MSAGGLSYSALVNNGKITLPSVDTWGNNMNILRDPPKSITTRRKQKVGDTNSITTMIDESGDRACEAINVYARGVNPCVSVSYNNHGNNGGQRSGGIRIGGQQSSKLPYSIMKDGAFRPPLLLQEDLLPLSRMPRNTTSAFTKQGFVDFSKKMRTCGTSENTKEVNTTMLKGCVRPTAVYKLETPLSEPFEVKYVIQPVIKKSANSGLRTMDITQQHVGKPTKEIDVQPIHAMARSNFKENRHIDNNEFNPDRYIQDTNAHSVHSNISSNKHSTNLENIFDRSDIPVHEEILHSSMIAPISGVEKIKYLHKDINKKRVLPKYNARTNIVNPTIHKRMDHINNIKLERNMPKNSFTSNPMIRGETIQPSRDVHLAEKLQPGGYSNSGFIPRYK